MSKNVKMLEQIKDYCTKNGITGYELAKYLPLSQVALHGILTGTTTRPRMKNIKMIYDYLFKSNVVNEQPEKYDTGFDKKITEQEEKIKEIKKEIAKWEAKLKENPDKGDTYKKYIASYEEQIFLHNQIINITLEAKRDYLENSNE